MNVLLISIYRSGVKKIINKGYNVHHSNIHPPVFMTTMINPKQPIQPSKSLTMRWRNLWVFFKYSEFYSLRRHCLHFTVYLPTCLLMKEILTTSQAFGLSHHKQSFCPHFLSLDFLCYRLVLSRLFVHEAVEICKESAG